MAEVDRGMDVADMKRLLSKSKTEPVNAAIGLDGKNAVISLDKIKGPKILSKQLELKFKGLKNPRWGTASVDMEEDPKLVILTINKNAPGMGKLLRKTLKGSGFSKVRIQLEDGTIAEDVGDEDEEEAGESTETVALDHEDEGEFGKAAPEPEAPPPAPWNPAELTQRLGGLIKQIPQIVASAPDRLADLKDLAAKAAAAIKSGVEDTATAAVQALEQAMGGSGAEAPPAPPPPPPPLPPKISATALQKSGAIWLATRKRIQDEIGKLGEAMSKHYSGHDFASQLDTAFKSKVGPILDELDDELATQFDAASKVTDPRETSTLVADIQQTIDRYDQFLASNPLLSQLDANPFVPLTIVKTTQGTLTALRNTVAKAA